MREEDKSKVIECIKEARLARDRFMLARYALAELTDNEMLLNKTDFDSFEFDYGSIKIFPTITVHKGLCELAEILGCEVKRKPACNYDYFDYEEIRYVEWHWCDKAEAE